MALTPLTPLPQPQQQPQQPSENPGQRIGGGMHANGGSDMASSYVGGGHSGSGGVATYNSWGRQRTTAPLSSPQGSQGFQSFQRGGGSNR